MCYSSACNRNVFIEVTIAMFYICHSKKVLNIMKNVLIPSLQILEKTFLMNKYRKQICYKENKSPFL